MNVVLFLKVTGNMKGYAYTDNDGNIGFRLKTFIEIEDPLFWENNGHMIDTVWEIDTEDDVSMIKILSYFKRIEASSRVVIEFCKSVNFDLEAFKTRVNSPNYNANKVQSN